ILPTMLPSFFYTGIILLLSVFAGAFTFGFYLVVLILLGLDHVQGFTALGHPGFKHFLRLRIRQDGSAIDGWCFVLVDPIAEGEQPVLVDAFTWKTDGSVETRR